MLLSPGPKSQKVLYWSYITRVLCVILALLPAPYAFIVSTLCTFKTMIISLTTCSDEHQHDFDYSSHIWCRRSDHCRPSIRPLGLLVYYHLVSLKNNIKCLLYAHLWHGNMVWYMVVWSSIISRFKFQKFSFVYFTSESCK